MTACCPEEVLGTQPSASSWTRCPQCPGPPNPPESQLCEPAIPAAWNTCLSFSPCKHLLSPSPSAAPLYPHSPAGLAARSCPTHCNPIDCSLPGSSGHKDFPSKNTGVGCHFLLQKISPTQGSNWGLLCLPRWQVDSLPLSHLGSPHSLEGLLITAYHHLSLTLVGLTHIQPA